MAPTVRRHLSDSPLDSTYCHTFGLTKRIDPSLLNNSPIFIQGKEDLKGGLVELYEYLQSIIKSHTSSFMGNDEAPKKVLRIAIHNIGSPLWKLSLKVTLILIDDCPWHYLFRSLGYCCHLLLLW